MPKIDLDHMDRVNLVAGVVLASCVLSVLGVLYVPPGTAQAVLVLGPVVLVLGSLLGLAVARTDRHAAKARREDGHAEPARG